MCGILGVWDFKNRVDRTLLKKMRDTMEHRGPDDKGIFVDNQIGLAQRRLSIIDLSKAAAQKIGMIKTGTAFVKIELLEDIDDKKELKDKLEEIRRLTY